MNNLQNLFNDVVKDEAEEDDLDPQNKVVPSIHVAQKLVFDHDDSISHFYRTRVRSLAMLVTHWLTHSLRNV